MQQSRWFDIPEDPNVKNQSEDSARKVAAAISGAIEGFLEAMEEHDVANVAQSGIEQAAHVAREGGAEARDLAQTPEMRAVGEKVSRAAQATGHAFGRATDNVKETVHDAKSSVQHTAERVHDGYHNAKEGVKVRADAVKESSRRAKVAPRRIMYHLRKALDAWWHGVITALAMMATMLVFGITTLIVVTIALVVGLNRLLGDPAGTFVVAGLYVVVMLIAFATMKSRRAHAREETARRVEYSKQEVRHVTAPVRSAFGGRGRTGF